MSCTQQLPHAGENWVITRQQIESLRVSAHRLLDHLTVVSGYGELALERPCHPDLHKKLSLIVGAVRSAKLELLSAMAVLDALAPRAGRNGD